MTGNDICYDVNGHHGTIITGTSHDSSRLVKLILLVMVLTGNDYHGSK